MSDNAIHDAEREESRCTSYGLSEMERAVACGSPGHGVCPDCIDYVKGEL